MDSLDVMQAVTPSGPNEIPAEYPNGDEWLEKTLEKTKKAEPVLTEGETYQIIHRIMIHHDVGNRKQNEQTSAYQWHVFSASKAFSRNISKQYRRAPLAFGDEIIRTTKK